MISYNILHVRTILINHLFFIFGVVDKDNIIAQWVIAINVQQVLFVYKFNGR